MFKVLIVDTDKEILTSLSETLTKENYTVYTTSSAVEAISLAKEKLPDMVILELLLPEMDGVEVCEELCSIRALNETLIVFYTQRKDEYSEVVALNSGADDYIVKPKRPRVLVARLKGLLRKHRAHIELMERGTVNRIKLDRERYVVFNNGVKIHLPRKEFELFALLYASPDKVVSRSEIGLKIWGHEIEKGNRTIDVHVKMLRNKLGVNSIKTVKGMGYKFDPND